MGKEGEGVEGGKKLKKEGDKLVIKSEPGAEPEKVIVMAILPSEEPTLIPYCVVEDQSDCKTLGSNDSDIVEIDKNEVRDVLKELAELKHKEADFLDKLAKAIPQMRDNEVVVLSERVEESEMSQCV